jgi:hypothetical protein
MYGPQPRPRPWFNGLPLWLYWLNLCSEVCLSCGGALNFFPILRRFTAVRINAMHWLGVAMLVFAVARSWGLVWL